MNFEFLMAFLHCYPTEERKKKKAKFPQRIVESRKNALKNHDLSKEQQDLFSP